MKKFLLTCLLAVGVLLGLGQTYNMDNTPVSTCSGTFYDSGGSGSNYSSSEDYTKTFSPSVAGNMLQFVFNSFSTESTYDYLYIYDGPTTGSPLIGTYTGSTSPGTITATNTGDITFRFTSDGSVTYAGWDATISCIPPAATYNHTSGGSTTACSGVYYDPQGTSDYLDFNGSQTHTFCSGTGQMIRFTFTEFETREAADNLSIYDGPTTGSPLIGTYSQTNNPGTITSTGTCLTFVWTTDGNGAARPGWTATISCVSPCHDEVIGSLPYSNTGMTTNGFGDDYSSTDACGSSYMNGDEYIFQYTPSSDETITIDLTNTSTYTGIFITDDCPDIGNCIDFAVNSAGNPTLSCVDLTAGVTYYFIVSTWPSPQYTNFDIDISVMTPPANDECVGAVPLTVNSDLTCTLVTSSSITGATNSGIAGCVGTADDDVWFSFVATNTNHDIDLLNVTGSTTDLVHEIFSGTCGSLTSIACSDPNSSSWTGFTVGNTYYIRVFTYTSTVCQNVDFEVCIGTPPPPPSNDEPCGAITLNVNSGSCSYQSATLETTALLSSGIPAPGCGSLGPDIWFKFTVPASGRIIVDMDDNGGPTDMCMAWYYSSTDDCNNIDNLIECDDDDSQNGAMPMICHAGAICTVPGDCNQEATLTPGMTVYVRVWEYGGGTFGPFDICAYEPDAPGAPSTCASAEVIGSLPYADNTTTCCRNNTYNSSVGCASTYQDGEDFIYEYTPSVDENIDITLTGTLGYTGIFVTEGCPDVGTCIASQTETGGNPLLCGVSLSAGTTYYIMVDTDPNPTCTPFNIGISSSNTPTCGLSYTGSVIAYAPDLNAGTDISLPIDDRFSSSYIPIGFDFCFDGFAHNQLLVSSNGYVIFDPVGCATNLPSSNASPGGTSGWSISAAIPNTTNAPRNCIMFPWQDLDPSIGGTIRYQVLGTAPNRRFVLTFANIPMFGSSCTAYDFNGQIKLFETTNNIEIHVTNKDLCTAWNSGYAIMGLHNYNGTTAITAAAYNYPNTYTLTNQAWRFTCNCPDCINLLPVEMTSFDFSCIGNTINLRWVTASESNNDYFLVERSFDGINFEAIGTVGGAGTTATPSEYFYADKNGENAYYRLKQVDYNGQYEYSNIIFAGCQDHTFSVGPNPAKLGEPINVFGEYNSIIVQDIMGRNVNVDIVDNKIYGLKCGVYVISIDGYYKLKIVIE